MLLNFFRAAKMAVGCGLLLADAVELRNHSVVGEGVDAGLNSNLWTGKLV